MTPGERIVALDALRGLALVGILAANLPVFAGIIALSPEQLAALPTSGIDRVVTRMTEVLVTGKFYSLFSLLFGIGFSLQLRRGTVSRFRRRMLVLLGIGAVHLALWVGDILFLYAVLGFCLVPAVRCSDRDLLRWSATMLALPALVWVVFHPVMAALGKPPLWPLSFFDYLMANVYVPYDTAYQRGDLLEVLRLNADLVLFERLPYFVTSGRPFRVMAMFLLGLWVGRRGIPGDLATHRPLLQRAAWWGIGLGLPANVALAFLPHAATGSAVHAFLEPWCVALLAVGYAAGVGLLMGRPTAPRWLAGLAPLGRMALTVYLTQTVACVLFYSGVVTGWYATQGASLVVLAVPVLIPLQLLAARWWLARHPQGPFEWLWRRLI